MKKTPAIFIFFVIFILSLLISCKKHDDIVPDNTTNTIKIDSIIPAKRNLIVWEESNITVYARGEKLSYLWEADHGSLLCKDSTTVIYYACPSCLGTNTIKCVVSNDSGSVSDTVMVHVTD